MRRRAIARGNGKIANIEIKKKKHAKKSHREGRECERERETEKKSLIKMII